MNFNIDPIPLFDYKNGDQVTAEDVNAVAIKVYNKYNALNPNNISPINTGMFFDSASSIYYPNYCGWFAASLIRTDELNDLMDETTDEITEIIESYTGG